MQWAAQRWLRSEAAGKTEGYQALLMTPKSVSFAGKTAIIALPQDVVESSMPKERSGQQAKRVKKDRRVELHSLYEAAVQNVDADLEFIERVFRKLRGRPPRSLREDFCGTASLAASFAARHRDNRAFGIDLDRKTLDWGERYRVRILKDGAAERVSLVRGDVRTTQVGPVDVATAFNFSYWFFKTRPELHDYLTQACSDLGPDGILFLDAFGGTQSMRVTEEHSKYASSRDPAGWKTPAFTYFWDQHRFNPIDHEFQCYIHFKLKDGTYIHRAFSYPWRFWTLPEIQELLLEAGFAKVLVYVEGWDDELDESDGIFRRRKRFDNEGSWLVYLVALKEL